ncbi:hypothetical protein DL763_011230 [Monosporascus cannonballus]|nr:hypothetical protein DL763_011230 [Monosporascus cannonballus]
MYLCSSKRHTRASRAPGLKSSNLRLPRPPATTTAATAQRHDAAHEPGGPPHAPDYERGIQAPDAPPEGGLGQQMPHAPSFAEVPGRDGGADGDDGGRAERVEDERIGHPGRGPGMGGGREGQRGREQADEQREAEIERRERAEEHAEQQEREGLEELAELPPLLRR